ncbi:tautomerase family protein [Corallococcus macrosporus]|uniref:Tautomerase family protein n=1 Tax=Corallococcus macrosporus TaxID=35 RepID=A0ABS3DJN7_9BACT|nr:tautomerase family protein [Corallococcus macrosporus]MBN8231537.1 tautomerase family protein [Corallococcus macrosporus]
MPIISIRFIKDVVATPEQKKELVSRMTDTFVSVLGDVVRPFTYCLIEEVPQGQWGIAGVPMPDLPFLTGEEYARIYKDSSDVMKAAIAQMSAANDNEPSDS